MIHGEISCSSILLNDIGDVKISMQENCRSISKVDQTNNVDRRGLNKIIIQLIEKRTRDEISNQNDLCHWSLSIEDFMLKIMSVSAETLLQVSLNSL